MATKTEQYEQKKKLSNRQQQQQQQKNLFIKKKKLERKKGRNIHEKELGIRFWRWNKAPVKYCSACKSKWNARTVKYDYVRCECVCV